VNDNSKPKPVDPLDQAILDLIGRLPLKWEQADTDAWTATEQEALKLLVAAGMVDQRLSFRLSLIGHSDVIEAAIRGTGERGFVQAMEPVARAAWKAWACDYLKGNAGAEQDAGVQLRKNRGVTGPAYDARHTSQRGC
jgi:hypothetical protein